MKVLIIDDDDDIREMARVGLGMRQVEVLDAPSGAIGLQKAIEHRPDAILLDVMMPFMDGPATLAALRANPDTASIPVIFVTASVMRAELERLEGLGALAILAKPIDPFTLAVQIRTLVEAHRPTATTSVVAPPEHEPGFEDLRAAFLSRAPARLEKAEGLLARLDKDPADGQAFHDLTRIFHNLAGTGTSYGFPRASALGKEGELQCLAIAQAGATPTGMDVENWRRIVDGLRGELLEAPATTPAASPAEKPAAMERLHILVVNGEADVRQTISSLVEQEGLSVRAVSTHAEAIRELQERLPDGVITDVGLPDGSGYELVNYIRGLPEGESLPVIVLSPGSAFTDKVEAIHCGADAFFEKPLDWKALMRRLHHLLEASRPRAIKILYVEDDPEQAAYVRAILESAGHAVVICDDPERFEAVLLEVQPDLVLMDIMLPSISGYDLVRYIRQDERHATLPVLFLTTEGQLQSRFKSARVGGDDHLVKPVAPALLLSVVASRVERARFLKNLLDRDGLTRLLTHTALLERAQAIQARQSRDPGKVAAWVMIDVDHFKSVNDRYGHPVGDRVLSALSALLRRRLRQSDTIGRYGGEEFAVLFEELPEDEVVRLVSRVREEFARLEHEAAGHPNFRTTFSAGVSLLRDSMTLDEWKKAADDALYAAKAAGRNRVVSATG